jgi:hypothetical protein
VLHWFGACRSAWLIMRSTWPEHPFPNVTHRSTPLVVVASAEDGAFGIRIENVVEVLSVPQDQLAAAGKSPFMKFRPVTLFPIQAKMIAIEMLTDLELDWVNRYHVDVCDAIAPLLSEQGRGEALAWLQESTQPITRAAVDAV